LRLDVRGLSKRFCGETRRTLRYALFDAAAEWLPNRRPLRLRPGEFMAVDRVDFTLHGGEALAVLGQNGSGKSTLLKVIYGLQRPSAGTVRRQGSIGALLDLGTGLHPALSGRENVALAAVIAGSPQSAFPHLLDDIVAFAELSTAIDLPFHSYSTGMKARLAFATATALKPDILLVDEALAVADARFQARCVGRLRAFVEDGGSVLLVSHNIEQVQALCARAILLERGRAVATGPTTEVVHRIGESRETLSGADPNAFA
jgi:lipopolysaccharide transport system ATP-binding protein